MGEAEDPGGLAWLTDQLPMVGGDDSPGVPTESRWYKLLRVVGAIGAVTPMLCVAQWADPGDRACRWRLPILSVCDCQSRHGSVAFRWVRRTGQAAAHGCLAEGLPPF